MSNIIVFQGFEELKQKAERLRTELSMLLLERYELQFVICKNIETIYMLKLGSLEYKAYEAQCNFLRLKRKLELIQAKKNRQEKVILSDIEMILDQEFVKYQERLNEQIDKMNTAIEHSKGTTLSDEENKELKKIYRKIVKSIHPDVNPDITESQRTLFENAVEAYKSGDLPTLKIIGGMVAEPNIPEKSIDAMTALKDNAENLEKMIISVQEDIAEIKNSYPYTMKDIVEDEEKMAEQKGKIENIIAQYNEGIALYQAQIDKLMRC